jgi:hypothetical protein
MSPIPQYALCIERGEYEVSLELHKVYEVLPPEPNDRGMIRVIDESGEDYLFPRSWFVVLDLPAEVIEALARAPDIHTPLARSSWALTSDS